MTDPGKHPYGYCPECYKPGKSRERRPDGNDTCVDGHSYPSKNALFPGKKIGKVDPPRVPNEAKLTPESTAGAFKVEVGPQTKPQVALLVPAGSNLTPEQEKAISLIVSGFAFTLVAMRPTVEQVDGSYRICNAGEEATGCDFLTCMHGSKETLLAAKGELAGVLERLYAKRGLM